jgi:catechol 2,3-dioxygenase-like lactoylglutathione lyase family enzyme
MLSVLRPPIQPEPQMPLTHQNPIASIPTADADIARTFYEQTLGLTFISQDQFAIVFRVGPAQTTLRVVCAPGGFTPTPFSIFGWEVDDIDASITELSGKGIDFLRYGFFEQQPNGVWLAPGGAAIAWFKDPDGNTLSLSHQPNP